MLLSLLVREWRSAAWSSSVEAGGTVHMVRDIIEEVASRSRHPWRCRSGRDPGATPSASAPSNERSATCNTRRQGRHRLRLLLVADKGDGVLSTCPDIGIDS